MGSALLSMPVVAMPPPPPPPNLLHFEVEGIPFECRLEPEGTRLSACRIMVQEGYLNVQIQYLPAYGRFYFWAVRNCALSDASNPDARKRSGFLRPRQLPDGELPQALADLQALPGDPACAPLARETEEKAPILERLVKALILLDNLSHE